MNFQYYQINKGGKMNGRETRKQIRIINKDGNMEILKKNESRNVIHTYTFKNGMTRKWFTTSNKNENFMKKVVNGGITGWYSDFYFLVDKDDEIFYKYRYALKLTKTTNYYNADGSKNKYQHPFVVHEIITDSSETTKNISGSIRRDYTNSYEITEFTSESLLICEKWVKWGMFEILLDDGIRKSNKYLYDDPYPSQIAHPSAYLKLTEMRNSSPNNPFDDPYEPELKKMRDERNWFKEQIAMKTFEPSRVMRMMEKYGDDWMEQV